MEQLYAGAAAWDMTPPQGVTLAGYPHFDRPNTGAHDPLMATCIYLRRGETELALVTLDILYFSKQYTRAVRARVEEACGMKGAGILCCCSHTHSGPWAAGNPEMDAQCGKAGDQDPEYVAALLDGITELILRARKEAFPAEVGVTAIRCGAEKGIGGNRRSPDGICDPMLGVLAVRDGSGVIRGILTTYALHPTFLHEDSTLVSADYPAYLRIAICEKYPEAVVGFAQGCSGDQSSRYFRTGQSFDEAERVGRTMAGSALEALEKMSFDAAPELGYASEETPLRIRSYPPSSEVRKEVEKFTREYNEYKAAGASYLDVQNANLRMLGAEDRLGYALCLEEGRPIALRDDENPAEVMVIRIGKWCVAGIPGEVFVEYGLRIKAGIKAETTLVFELSNGCLPGYCINAEAFYEGGYEAGNSMLELNFGNVLGDMAIGLAGGLKK